MNVVYSFIGSLPAYAIDTVHQLRYFYTGPVYFILDDLSSDAKTILEKKYNVTIVPYTDVKSKEFDDIAASCASRFGIVYGLKGRELLFLRALERFFLLEKLMILKNLKNVLFVELDNLLYDDPSNWLTHLCKSNAAYMIDNYDRCSSGVCFFKDTDILHKLNLYFLKFIQTSNKLLSEMPALYEFWQASGADAAKDIQILPTLWPSATDAERIPSAAYAKYDLYNESIFDAAALGIYLGGIDLIHSNNVLKKGVISTASAINCSNYRFQWHTDSEGRKIPHIYDKESDKWIKINNLHIHSKHLIDCLSKPFQNLILSENSFKLCCKLGLC